ncbi:MAG: UDP-N-acetylmuramoyl-L-alanyl-D-glutamate--2,6-diaminopimelate ligase [Hyphomicrobiaceae bacterium]|nr:UDP-N-acetylmuramoyl-L-alanyl-D-glutamate--2,6-diaminopimelate ligase [Hyphomicrobiaceae bacterium]
MSRLIAKGVAIETSSLDPDITGLTADSRAVHPGTLFAALAGSRTDGARFIADAIERGASAILLGNEARPEIPAGVAVVRASEPRRALALMAARMYAPQPATVVAITGTNGKTSIAEFVRQIFAACGRSAASLGTIGIVKPDGAIYGSLTTPDPVTLHRTLAGLAAEGVTHLALEASSHGLDQFRLDGVRLAAGAFNNLGRDHLDYHPTMEAYLAAKLRLWQLLEPGQPAVVNADGQAGAEAVAAGRARGLRVVTTGRTGDMLRLVDVAQVGFGQRLRIAHGSVEWTVDVPLIGAYQAGNALVAAALAIECGERLEPVIRSLVSLQGVKGRLEVVAETRGGIAVVDYAHKPEALEAALAALRPFATGKLVCIVGCGGDRDRGKRPIMGRIAAAGADVAIITDDNPRSEAPALIRAEMLADARGALEIGDRAEAIRAGVRMLGPGDVLLVAGKGHETGQIVGDAVLPFSDHEEILQAAKELEA